jgi:hypothetical protein
VADFLAGFARAGYAEKTQHDKRRAVVPFVRWQRDARIAVADLDEACVDAFLARPSRRRCKYRDPAQAALRQFLAHLRLVGVVAPRSADTSSASALVRRYLDHLRDGRGLCPRSLEVYAPFVRAFVVAQRLPETGSALDAAGVRRYLLDHSRSRSFSSVRLLAAALRSFRGLLDRGDQRLVSSARRTQRSSNAAAARCGCWTTGAGPSPKARPTRCGRFGVLYASASRSRGVRGALHQSPGAAVAATAAWERRRAAHRAQLEVCRARLVTFPLSSPRAAVLLDVAERAISTFVEDQSDELRARLATYDVIGALQVRARLRALDFDPANTGSRSSSRRRKRSNSTGARAR